MTQILLEFGATTQAPVRRALETALADVTYALEVLPVQHTTDLLYRRVDTDPDQAYAEAVAGDISSIRFRGKGVHVTWALLFAPSFGADRARPWTGVVELTHASYRPLFDQLLKNEGLHFLVASEEETLDLTPALIDPETFPWNEPRIIAAAVQTSSRVKAEWIIRFGPAAARGG
jgi:hypothetical protein